MSGWNLQPGSDEARRNGCICDPVHNFPIPSKENGRRWHIQPDCRHHGCGSAIERFYSIPTFGVGEDGRETRKGGR